MPKKAPKVYPSQRDRPVLGVRLPLDTADQLRGMARRCGVSLSALLEGVATEMVRREAEHDASDHDCPGAACRIIYTPVAGVRARDA